MRVFQILLLYNASYPNGTALIVYSCSGRNMKDLNVLHGAVAKVEDV